ncbi:ASCH domain-containing protein [Pseudescherichia vulneris]|uniref:ASCH domain-containing protein n=1 Tax=Pseudescherichia vulneris TaxID=566 RepID=UPI00227A5F15|nr:ASCH domain-containing protein [Pseudescherichia vulneris]WAH52979.1 ASCH domain-containing protein [Pseudescherichia vulneris]
MNMLEKLKTKYPQALAWSIGDSVELANQLADLVVKGKKTASCGSLAAYQSEDNPPKVGSYHIILNGQQEPVCVIRITSLRLVRFCDVDEAFARKEGEGDLSLTYWRTEHQRFFTQAGSFSEEMELVAEEFEVVEVV